MSTSIGRPPLAISCAASKVLGSAQWPSSTTNSAGPFRDELVGPRRDLERRGRGLPHDGAKGMQRAERLAAAAVDGPHGVPPALEVPGELENLA